MSENNRRIRLAIISRRFIPDVKGGAENIFYNIWERAKEVYDAILILGWKNSPQGLPNSAYKVQLSGKNKPFDYIKFYLFCRNILKKENPDLVLVNNFEVTLKSIPHIIYVSSLNHDQIFNKKNRLRRFINKRRIRRARRVIAISNYIKEELIKLGLDIRKVKTIYNGIDYEKFKMVSEITDKFTVVYPSRIVESKGQHIAIEAMKALPREILMNIELILAGFVEDDKYLQNLKEISRGLPVTIEPNVEHIEKYYYKADIIIFPTLMQEGFGFLAIEAMACAKPVVYSDVPAIREATGDIGLKIKLGDQKGLASQIEKLYTNKELRDSLAKEGFEYVKSHYHWDKTFAEFQNIFNEFKLV